MQSLVMLLVVIYLRVSTEDQAKKGFSLPEQREACLRKAKELASQLEASTHQQVDLQLREFVDDFGGDIMERPVLEQVRELVRAQKPRYFICMDPDRFSRSLKWQLILADEIEAQGTRLVFVQQEYDPTDVMSRAFFQFRGLMSEIDKAKILERTSRGKRGKIKAGKRPNGACPYGYRHNKETDQLEVYEPEAQWVRQMFRWVLEDGLSVHLVTRRLNEVGAPQKRSNHWYRSVVREMLANTSYRGEMVCNRKNTTGLGAIRRLPVTKRKKLTALSRPTAEWLTVPVPPLVDTETFNQVQDRLRSTTKRGHRRGTYLLSLLLRCGQCGGPLAYQHHKKSSRNYMWCPRRHAAKGDFRPGTQVCDNGFHRAEQVEAAVWDRITTWLISPDLLEEHLRSQGTDRQRVEEQVSRLHEERSAIVTQIETQQRAQIIIVQKQVRGILTEAAADVMLNEIKTHLDGLEPRLTELTNQLHNLNSYAQKLTAAVDVYRETAAMIATEADAVRRKLDGLGPELRRKLVVQLISAVFIRADGYWWIDPRSAPEHHM